MKNKKIGQIIVKGEKDKNPAGERQVNSPTQTTMPQKKKINWMNASFITISPVVALVSAILCVYYSGFHLVDFVIFNVMWWSVGISVTGGYHRLFSHRAYQASSPLKIFYLLFGAAALENSALSWSSDHRDHHQFVDQEKDPYNIKKGFFWAHMGWIYYAAPDDRSYDNVKDLKKDKWVMFQHRYYLPIAILVGFGIPTLIGAFFGRPLEGFIWGGLVRSVLLHHMTFLINSAAHVFGRQPYSSASSAVDSWWLPFFTFGEGYHNFHHTFAGDYRNGRRWYHWDPAKWFVFSLSKVGVTRLLQRTPDEVVWRYQMEVQAQRAATMSDGLPERLSIAMNEKMDAARQSTEKALAEFEKFKRNYQAWVREQKSALNRVQFKAQTSEWTTNMRAYRQRARESYREFQQTVRLIRRTCRSYA